MSSMQPEAEVVDGVVHIGDWVRERPADHFQPCYCCLCRPPGGERPIMEVRGIDVRNDVVYLRFADQSAFPADEFERAPSPRPGERLAAAVAPANQLRLLRAMRA